MKKTSIVLISLLLCLGLLFGCAAPSTVVSSGESTVINFEPPEIETQKFSQLEYKRPDVDGLNETADALYEALSSPLKLVQVQELLNEFYALYYEFEAMYSLAYIRNCHDMSDSFYAEEYFWLSQRDAEVQLLIEYVYTACAYSVHAPWLEEFLFWPGFREEYGEEAEYISDEVNMRYLSLAAEEARLLGEYRQLMSAPTIELNGQEIDFDEYVASIDYYDVEGVNRYYEKYNPILAEIYIELLQNRREQAELLGYSSYPEMAYDLGYDRDYSVRESERFMAHVKEHLAPLGAQRLEGLETFGAAIESPGERDLELFLETAAEGLGAEFEEAYSFMREYELYDFEQSFDKADTSFVMYLDRYEAPYIFLCPYGVPDDYLALFHEFGHYADNYIRAGAEEGMDLSESFSQAMQFLSLKPLESILTQEESDEFLRMNMLDILDTYLQQTAIAEFELRAYEMENPSVEKLNQLCLDVTNAYGIYDEYVGSANEYYWVEITHLFESPLYVISYPVSAGLALQLYELELERDGAGSEKFVELSECGLAGLMEAVEYAGLQDPKSEERIISVSKIIESAIN